MSSTKQEILTRSVPFPSWISDYIDFEPLKDSTFCELEKGSKLYELCGNYIVKQTNQSYVFHPKENVSDATEILERLARELYNRKNNELKEEELGNNVTENDKENKDENKEEKKEQEKKTKVETTLGLGLHVFKYNNINFYALHQTLGLPVAQGWGCGNPPLHKSLVIFIKGSNQKKLLEKFMTFIIEENETKKDSLFVTIYRWHIEYQYWQRCTKKIARDPSTIILPHETYDKLTKDIERFLDYNTIKWYFKHGIPYKRSYLFHGVPGSGKSSLIQSLAARYNRNLCFLQPTHPKMTDDAFKNCISKAPKNSLVVLEDIDALFTKDRKKKHMDCPLTFSGLLNGLDGIGIPDGQIFILTTNFVNRLDNALIRAGRVDLHIEFPLATDEQIKNMYLLFYPNGYEYSELFLNEIRKHFTNGISMSAVQQHFIQNMLEEQQTVIDNVYQLGERLDVVSKIKAKEKKSKEKKRNKKHHGPNDGNVDNESDEDEDDEDDEDEDEDSDDDNGGNKNKKKKNQNGPKKQTKDAGAMTGLMVIGLVMLVIQKFC